MRTGLVAELKGRYGHVAGVEEAAATDEAKVLIHHGLVAERAVERQSGTHPHGAGCVVHGAPAEALAAPAVPDLVLRTSGVSVDLELAEDLEADLVHHREDLPVVLSASQRVREARFSEPVHQLWLWNRTCGTYSKAAPPEIVVVQAIAEAELDVDARRTARLIGREGVGVEPIGVVGSFSRRCQYW